MRLMPMAALAAAITMLSIGAIACGDDDDDDGADNGDPTQPAAAATATQEPELTEPTAEASEPAGGAAVRVTAADFSFSPASLTIDGASDTTITLDNAGSTPHTMNVYYDAGYTDALRDTGNVSPGASGELTIESNSVEQAPELFFRCEIHPSQMEGTIAVQ